MWYLYYIEWDYIIAYGNIINYSPIRKLNIAPQLPYMNYAICSVISYYSFASSRGGHMWHSL